MFSPYFIVSHPTSAPTSTPTSSLVNGLNPNSKIYTNNNFVIELVRVIGDEELGIRQEDMNIIEDAARNGGTTPGGDEA